jgi:hypothetical protein
VSNPPPLYVALPQSPTAVAANVSGPLEFLIGWNATADDGSTLNNGLLVQYVVELAHIGTNYASLFFTTRGNETSLRVIGLFPAQIYGVRVASQNAVGLSGFTSFIFIVAVGTFLSLSYSLFNFVNKSSIIFLFFYFIFLVQLLFYNLFEQRLRIFFVQLFCNMTQNTNQVFLISF